MVLKALAQETVVCYVQCDKQTFHCLPTREMIDGCKAVAEDVRGLPVQV